WTTRTWRRAARTAAAILFAMATLHGCAASRGSRGPAPSGNVILQSEMQDSHQPTLFDVVRALRPMWLRVERSALRSDQETGITVYLGDHRAGGLEILQQMTTGSASSLRFYSASEATSRFGLGNLHGVIQVVSARGPTSGPT